MKRLLAASLILGLAACASNPPYARAPSPTAQGYSEQMVSQDRWRVRYTGSRSMSPAQVQDYALLRAAQLTLEQGRDWFEVVSRDTDQDEKQRYWLDTQYRPDYAVRRSCGLVGCTTEATPVLVREQVERVDTRIVYEHWMGIVVGSGAPTASPAFYDAQETFNTLKSRIG